VVAAIKTKRHSVGLTAAEVAQRSGIPLDTIRAIEQGRTLTPSFLVVAGIARALDTSTNEFAEAIWGTK
jgi:transcriptional regulator with XRE-family HTH domain